MKNAEEVSGPVSKQDPLHLVRCFTSSEARLIAKLQRRWPGVFAGVFGGQGLLVGFYKLFFKKVLLFFSFSSGVYLPQVWETR